MRFTHIALDVDGTIIDTRDTFTYSLSKCIRDLRGEEISPADLVRYFGVTSMGTIEMLKFEDASMALELWEKYYCEMYAEKSRVFDGMDGVIRRLSAAGVTLGLVTSRNHEEIERDPNLARWSGIMQIKVSSEDTANPKPAADPALEFVRQAGVPASQCLYIGDTMYDALCARNAGVAFGLADWDGIAEEGIPADFHFRSPVEILDLFL